MQLFRYVRDIFIFLTNLKAPKLTNILVVGACFLILLENNAFLSPSLRSWILISKFWIDLRFIRIEVILNFKFSKINKWNAYFLKKHLWKHQFVQIKLSQGLYPWIVIIRYSIIDNYQLNSMKLNFDNINFLLNFS